MFRHTCATHLANVAKVPLPLLQKFLGHRSLETTMRYLHAGADDVAAAIRGAGLREVHDGEPKQSLGHHHDGDKKVDGDGKSEAVKT